MEMRHIVAILQRAYHTEFSGTGKEGQDGRRRKKINQKRPKHYLYHTSTTVQTSTPKWKISPSNKSAISGPRNIS